MSKPAPCIFNSILSISSQVRNLLLLGECHEREELRKYISTEHLRELLDQAMSFFESVTNGPSALRVNDAVLAHLKERVALPNASRSGYVDRVARYAIQGEGWYQGGGGSAATAAIESARSAPPQHPNDSSPTGSVYSCTYRGCTHMFATSALLQGHKRNDHWQASQARQPKATGATPSQAGHYRCNQCGRGYQRASDLARHEASHDPNRQRFTCNRCNRQFTRLESLTRHSNSKICISGRSSV